MTKVFIIDDDVMVRYALSSIINQEADLSVVGDAPPSKELKSLIEKSKPDLLVFDIPIPRETGIVQLKELKKLRLPAIVFTKSSDDIARDLIPLLECGAVGFVLKPASNQAIDLVSRDLIHEIRINQKKSKIIEKVNKINKESLYPLKLVAIGSSTGGPEALVEIIKDIPSSFEAGIVIVQHMPKDFTERFAARLNGLGGVVVKEAQTGDVVKPGLALLAPGDYHMQFEKFVLDGKTQMRVVLNQDPAQWLLRPTVDKMMISAAPIYKKNCLGVILTGMGSDGVVGMNQVKLYGGSTLVQDKQSSIVFGMGQEVIKNNLADKVVPLKKIAEKIKEWTILGRMI